MSCFSIKGNAGMFLLAFLFLVHMNSFAQCIVTTESRENITSDATQIAGAKSKSISSSHINIAYTSQGNGAKLTVSFSGSNNTYYNDTIRLVGNMTVESISRGNNTLNGAVFVVTENSSITFKSIDISNSSNIRFINYGTMTFQNSFTMPSNTIFVNKLSSSVLIFNNTVNFANNSNTIVLNSNGGMVNFNNGFTLQSGNKFCLTGYTQVNTTSIVNNVSNGIYVPTSFSACLKYTGSASLNTTLTNGPGFLYVAQETGATSPSNLQKWGTSIVNINSSGCNVILPAVLKNFGVVSQSTYVMLKWSTTSELNSAAFDIEKSIDDINYKTIGSVKAKGYSTSQSDYSFKDQKQLEPVKYYYRLKMIDKNGSYTYSPVKYINLFNNADKLKVIKSGNTIFTIFPSIKNDATLLAYDISGKVVYLKKLLYGETTATIDCHLFSPGSYFVVLVSNTSKESVHIAF